MGQIFILKMRKLELRDGNLLTVMVFIGIYVTRFLGFPITVGFSQFRSDGVFSQVVSLKIGKVNSQVLQKEQSQ